MLIKEGPGAPSQWAQGHLGRSEILKMVRGK